MYVYIYTYLYIYTYMPCANSLPPILFPPLPLSSPLSSVHSPLSSVHFPLSPGFTRRIQKSIFSNSKPAQ